MNRQGDVEVVVAERQELAENVVMLSLRNRSGAVLPAWSPGAHIDVVLADGRERQYSLCGDPYDRHTWRIAVLRERDVSAYLHDHVGAGSPLITRGPRNHFAFAPFPGKRYLFLAGGIGITAIMPMIESARRSGNEFRLVYAGRSRASMAFAAELTESLGERVTVLPADEGLRMDVAGLLTDPDPATVVYCCGPARLLRAVEESTAAWPRGTVRLERFQASVLGPPEWAEPFEVELMLSGENIVVPPDRSILEVIEDLGIPVLASCRVGTCGTCEVPVIDGDVEHRDSVLAPEEKQDNFAMMICVSRARGPKITIEL